MWRIAFLLVLLPASAAAADLPPGALVRLGDARFRAGGGIEHLAISPDGKQFATAHKTGRATFILTVWDAVTGRPAREQELNDELFKGFMWVPSGGFAIVIRAEPETKDEPARVFPNDFRVWEFTDPKAKAPPLLPAMRVGLSGFGGVEARRPRGGPEYIDFQISADGGRVAARWESGNGKHAVHVFELKPADTAAKLKRVGTIDLGAEGADDVSLSADGKTLVTFRELTSPGAREQAATTWDVATGKPAKLVRVPKSNRLIVAPNARLLVTFVAEDKEWGFDSYALETGERRQLTRWKYTLPGDSPPNEWGGFAFAPSGRELAVVIDRKTHVIDLVAGKELGRLEGHAEREVLDGSGILTAVSADGTRIGTADDYGLVRLWDAKTLRAVNEAPGHRAPVRYAELSPDGKRLLTWAADETVRLWDLATGKELRAFAGAACGYGEGGRVEGAATFTPDGTAILYSTKERLVARDLITGLETPLPGEMAKLESRFAVFAPDGKTVMTWAEGMNQWFSCEVWDWPSGKKRFVVEDNNGLRSPGFSPDGLALFLNASAPKRWDAKTGKELIPAWDDNDERAISPVLSLRPNPRWLLRESGRVSEVIEAGTAKPLTRFRLPPAEADEAPPRFLGDVALSPTGGQYAGVGYMTPEGMQISESATYTVRRTLKGHRGKVRVLGFTPDGTKLLTAGGDHTVLVWDMRLAHVPLPDAIKKETDAAKLWKMLDGNAKDAYLAMARLAREPDAAIKLARMHLKPVPKGERGPSGIADPRAVELLEALDTDDSRKLLKELAAGEPSASRTKEAKRALERNTR